MHVIEVIDVVRERAAEEVALVAREAHRLRLIGDRRRLSSERIEVVLLDPLGSGVRDRPHRPEVIEMEVPRARGRRAREQSAVAIDVIFLPALGSL